MRSCDGEVESEYMSVKLVGVRVCMRAYACIIFGRAFNLRFLKTFKSFSRSLSANCVIYQRQGKDGKGLRLEILKISYVLIGPALLGTFSLSHLGGK